MSSLKEENTLPIIIRPDDTRMRDSPVKKTKDLPIFILPRDILEYEYRSSDNIFLFFWWTKEIKREVRCSLCNHLVNKTTGYYVCNRFSMNNRFRVRFHKECIEPIQKNPYHPKHSLQVLMYCPEGGKQCYCCYGNKKYFHSCSVCEFDICHECVQEKPLLTIKHEIRHKHTLNYIHRKASITCDICGFSDGRHFIYMCYQCDFVVHKECIYLPRILGIKPHRHEVIFVSSFISGKKCEICKKHYDVNYGGYYCSSCGIIVHCKCALAALSWDGDELERKGKRNTFRQCHKCRKNCPCFIFQKEIYKANEREKQCQACTLLIYDGEHFYACKTCDLVIHKLCSYFPERKIHPKHLHPLFLAGDSTKGNIFRCSACKRVCNSSVYNCSDCNFSLDINCASIPQALNYHSHNHFLFLSSETESSIICSICKKSQTYYLECEECEFALCFGCVTLPKKLMYKHDEHLLVFTFGQDVSGQYWCDMCEDKINQNYGIYTCNDCNVALHVGCICGEDMFMLHGKKEIQFLNGVEVKGEILLNEGLTRYICKYCHKRCQNKLILKNVFGDIFCSGSCLHISITGNDI